ncbi:hypothetical protein BDP27DRAFT_1325957 [Rhodocollybia butyracea]|uniref:Hyaluronan/mRNA-binding protein domain-containing protein n=1 Tax=Rhodocollybia butyracea TaxID=206335 RepID=A0A9P5PNG1_9AGAR|nr:hypothetical protein BDP27DRAFT_1325957 [Rhodocollybia butyracea]
MSGVASKNPFALLDEGKTPAVVAPAPAKDKKPQQKPRGGQYYKRGGGPRTEGNPNQNGIEEESAPRKFEGRGEGRGRGRGGPRGGRGARGGRPDRHSQSEDSDKKIHQGWGGDDGNTELVQETAATVDAAAEGAWGGAAESAPAADAWAPLLKTTPDKPERENRRREEEEEDNTLTLDQYLAQKKEKEAAALPEKPKADAVAIHKSGEEDAYFVGKSKNAAPKPRAKKEEKVFIEIDGRFSDSGRGQRGRGGRGGRGGSRGDGRGGNRGGGGGRRGQNNGPASNVNVDDESAFPSLS